MKKGAIVIHSGGMDSSICLALAIRDWGVENVLSLSFAYGQRHSKELVQAAKICRDWGVDHVEISLECLREITDNALMNPSLPIAHKEGGAPNTLVAGRNGLMARLGAIHAHHLGARCIYMGVIEVEEANSGYRDCSRVYMDYIEAALRLDFDDPEFEICTPVVKMTKKETLELADSRGVLEYLLEETISCYEGLRRAGCGRCPACLLRNAGLTDYLQTQTSRRQP